MARPESKLKELKTAELRHEVGARSDLVVKVNRRSERRIIPYGEEFLFEKLPVGTRVIYPPPPMDPQSIEKLIEIAEQYGQKVYPPDFLG